MAWLLVTIAGILEIGWGISLKLTEGFTKIIPIIFYAAFGLGSAFFLSQSMKTLPLATAYATWMGIAVVGISIAEVTHFGHSFSLGKALCIALIVGGIVGLKIIDPSS